MEHLLVSRCYKGCKLKRNVFCFQEKQSDGGERYMDSWHSKTSSLRHELWSRPGKIQWEKEEGQKISMCEALAILGENQ
jgi:hypothetical protein